MLTRARSLTVVAALAAFAVSCAPDPDPLRVATYNIRHGRGSDDSLDLLRTATVLRALDADIVALQEVDDGVARSGSVDEAATLGAALGMQHAFGAFMDYQGGRYGLAILSRHPIVSHEAVRLPDGNEPRVALFARVRLPDARETMVVNIHLDWVDDDGFRFAQAQALRAHLDTLSVPFILLGDFNDLPESRTLHLLRERALEVAKAPQSRLTFPAPAPEREIDYVVVGPRDAWFTAGAAAIDERVASDHRPVLAVVRLRGERPPR